MKAREYYTHVANKNIEGVKQFLDPNVEFYGPMATLKGKEAVAKATSHFMEAIRSLTIRAHFQSDDQAMVVYSVDMPDVSSDFPGASFLTFRGEKIVRIELFYDASRMLKKKEEIFS